MQVSNQDSLTVMIYFRDGSSSYGVSPIRAKELLEQRLDDDRFHFVIPSSDEEADLLPMLDECNALIGTSATLDPKIARIIGKLKGRLEFIQCIGAGIENFPLDTLQNNKIKLADASGASAIAVAEQAFSLMIALSKKTCLKDREIKSGTWRKESVSEIFGKTVTILGYGSIGAELAKRASAFGMKIIGVRKHPEKTTVTPPNCRVVGLDELSTTLKESDYLVVSLPLTKETSSLIGERELHLMKRGSFVINVARGSIISENALKEALEKGWIAGAGLDVWYAYPPDPTTPSRLGLHLLPNLVASPHIASTTIESVERTFDIIVENLNELVSKKNFINLVDPGLGY